MDTINRRDTVIRKKDLAINTELEPKLKQIVACKTLGEYIRNQEKIQQFLLTEKRPQSNPNTKTTIRPIPQNSHMEYANVIDYRLPTGRAGPSSYKQTVNSKTINQKNQSTRTQKRKGSMHSKTPATK